MKRVLIVAFVVTVTALGARAEHILLPIFVYHVTGAGGSIWSSEFSVHNPTGTDVGLHQICPYLSPCAEYIATANSTVQPIQVVQSSHFQYPGLDLLVDDSALEGLSLQLRVFAVSHGTWGTIVPVVRWSRVTTSKLRFIQIPMAANLRHTVRIYAETPDNPLVVVRYFDDSAPGSVPIAERTLSLQISSAPLQVGFAQLSSSDLPGLSGVSRVRIEVVTADPAKRIWGMVSVTDAATQEFSIITPD